MSAVISVRVNEQEAEALQKAADLFQCGISTLMKKLAFERLEEEYDLRAIDEYEKAKEEGSLELIPFSEAIKELDS